MLRVIKGIIIINYSKINSRKGRIPGFLHYKFYKVKYSIQAYVFLQVFLFNPLKPNDPYSGRTAPLTSKRCILYIYSTNIGTEYFKHGIYSPFFFLSSKCSLFHNSNISGSCFIHILYTGCAKI